MNLSQMTHAHRPPHLISFIFLFLALVALFLLTAPAGADDFYEWTDDEGITHLSDDPIFVPDEYSDEAEVIEMEHPFRTLEPGEEPSAQEIYTYVPPDQTLTVEEAEEIFAEIMALWESESWAAMWDRGLPYSRTMYAEDDFINDMRLAQYRPISYTVSSIDMKPCLMRFHTDINFICKEGQECPNVNKRTPVLLRCNDGEWSVWLGDILHGDP